MAARKSSGMSRQEAGRKGAEARWGRQGNSTGRASTTRTTRTSRTQNQTTNRRSAANRQDDLEDRFSGRGRSSRQEAGRRGAEARWGQPSNSQGRNLRSENRNRQETTRSGSRSLSRDYSPAYFEDNSRRATFWDDYNPEFYNETGRRGNTSRWNDDEEERFSGRGGSNRQETNRRSPNSQWGFQEEEEEDFYPSGRGAGWIWGYEDEEDEEFSAPRNQRTNQRSQRTNHQEAGRRGGQTTASRRSNQTSREPARRSSQTRSSRSR